MNEDSDDEAPELTLVPPCPVTILSGFLGSGKTTLVQYILQSPDHGYRIAVIENEFGGGGEGLQVESLIATDGANQKSLVDLLELPNGCVCCTVKDSLVATLENLLKKRNDLDYIIIECSGMANPGPIATLFWLDEALDSRLRLDGIVTLVDAAHIEHQLVSTVEASQQVAYADRILLNKVDLIQSSDKIVSLHTQLSSINPAAMIRTTNYAQVPDLEWILNTDCFNSQRAKELEDIIAQQRLQHNDHDHSHDHDHEGPCTEACNEHVTHSHTTAVTTISLQRTGSVDLDKLNHWLASILWPQQDAKNSLITKLISSDQALDKSNSIAHQLGRDENAMEIFRIKGILSVMPLVAKELDVRQYILQAVHDLWEAYPSIDGKWASDADRNCRVIFIGRNLNEKQLQGGFDQCMI